MPEQTLSPEISKEAALKALTIFEERLRGERLFQSYAEPFDHEQPFGRDNVGPYQWQIEVHNASSEYTERLLMAANRVGKTMSAAAEVACHATGRYPKWWRGRKFKDEPTRVWCGSESWTASRDIVQEALLGSLGEEGTGWIPKEYLIDWKKRQAGVSDVVDTIYVKHVSGGLSVVTLKTYEQERKEWQGKAIHMCWLDEEPSMGIYTEALTRILDKRGVMLLTFTPLKGPSEVVRHFLTPEPGSSVFVKNVSWDDAPHLDEKSKNDLKNSYPPHERDTRTSGTPLLGTGSIFPVRDDDLSCAPFEIPSWWPRINGIDFGIDHPAACAWCAIDRDADTFYVYDCYKKSGETPIYHAAAIKKHGAWIPTAWPQDGIQRDKGSGVALKDQYRRQGVFMLKDYAHYRDERQNSREAGLIEMYEYMRTGKFKVFSTLSDWFEEKRLYHRDEGKVVDEYDDIMSATRYAFVMRGQARTRPPMTQQSQAPSRPISGNRVWTR